MRAVSVAKYQPPASSSAAEPSAITRPSASSTARVGAGGGELGVVRGDDHGLALVGAAAQIARQLGLRAAVHAARRLVEREHGRSAAPPSPPVTIASARRWRSPPERSRGLRSAIPASPTAASAAGGGLFGDALVDQVVAGVLQQQRDPPRALDAAARGLQQPGGVAQQRRLAGAVAAHQRDALAGGERQLDAAQDRRPVAQLVPDAPHSQRARSAPAGQHALRPRRTRSAACRRIEALPLGVDGVGRLAGRAGRPPRAAAARAQRRARLLDADRRRVQPGEREQLRAGRLQGGLVSRGPCQERSGSPS